MPRCLDELLFRGETIEEDINLDCARVAVTTHRIFALTSNKNSMEYDHADRTHLRDATVELAGNADSRNWTVRSSILGAALLSSGYVIEQSSFLAPLGIGDEATTTGTGLLAALSSALGLFSALFLLGGIAFVLAATALSAHYVRTRKRELIIELVDRDPIRIPVAEEEGQEAAARLRGWV